MRSVPSETPLRADISRMLSVGSPFTPVTLAHPTRGEEKLLYAMFGRGRSGGPHHYADAPVADAPVADAPVADAPAADASAADAPAAARVLRSSSDWQ